MFVEDAQALASGWRGKFPEYVKVCSLYGAGFYYIPGTDICMKVGGYVRYQINNGHGANASNGPFVGATSFNNRAINLDVDQRARAIATFDTRQQTAYGTLRTYLLMGFSQNTNAAGTTAPGNYATRAFIQIAGFTFGKATSFFDFVAGAAVAYNSGFTHSPDTGDAGQIVGAYTAQFGNGISGTIAIEQSRRNPTVYAGVANASYNFTGVLATDAYGAAAVAGTSATPDIVGNIRIDQAWGSAQLSVAAHDVSAAYYGAGVAGTAAAPVISEANGHPGGKWGYAISPGLRLNAPMIGPGDYFQTAFVYTQGAGRYASQSPGGTPLQRFSGNTVGFGFLEDAVFGNTAAAPGVFGNSIELTTAWSVFASYEHFWTPSLRTSLYGSYLEVTHNANAIGLICATGAAAGVNYGATCNPNFSTWNVGTRSQWNITKDFYVGVDVIYNKLNSATFNNTNTPVILTAPGGAASAKQTAFYTSSNQDVVSTTWRIHRDIVP